LSKSLIITEKPSVARDIAAALGDFQENDGYYESSRYLLTWAVGHLFELLEPEEIDAAYKRWTLDTLPIVPEEFRLKPKTGQSERIRTLKKLLARKDLSSLVNACDAGREGELIFREIVKHFGTAIPMRRLWLQSMTEEAIRQGFERLRPGEQLDGLAQAAECRAYSDWLIGMNATRALTKRLRGRRERGAWSAGRVQTPTLALLVDRELEVLAHIPRSYWRVTATFEFDGQNYSGAWFDPEFRPDQDEDRRDDRLFDEERARTIVAAVAGRPGLAEETRKPSRESPPPLFDLTSLQREGNRRFGWSARRTLSAAQRCYEAHKLLTYPRTESRCLPSDYRDVVGEVLRSLAQAGASRRSGSDGHLDPLVDYAEAARHLLEAGLENESRTFDDSRVSDHFAIIPTGRLPGPGLSGDDRRLFDLVVRRFLATFHPAAIWERVERTTTVEEHRFRSRARTLVTPGWRSVLGDGPSEDNGALAPLRPGEASASGVAVATTGAEAEAEETKPPARITEARLLSLMENAGEQIDDEDFAAALHEKGIGTPATRAEIIENLIAKGYLVRQGKALRTTAKGIRLIDILRRVHIDRLASAALTGEMEHHLLDVERGERTGSDFMSEMEDYAREIVAHAKTFEYDELYAQEPALGSCPRCGRDVLEYAWFYRCKANSKAEEDCPLRIWKDTSGRYIDRGSASMLLAQGATRVLEGFTARNGRTYRGMLEIDPETWTAKVRPSSWDDGTATAEPEYEVNPEPLGRCPFDEDCSVVESPTQFVCERKLKEAELGKNPSRPKPCGLALPRTVCKREMLREEAQVYLRNGRTDLLSDFTSRYGRPFSATLVLRKNGRHGFEFPPRTSRRGGRSRAQGAQADTSKKKSGGSKRGRRAASSGSSRSKSPGKRAAKGAAKRARGRPAAGSRASPRSEKSPETD
jgi:DNA topoisomerase-3